MSKTNIALESLLKRQEQIAARIESLKAKEATQQRKDDTRRKILIGAYILDKHDKADSMSSLIVELDRFLFKPNDRSLFGLPPKNEKDLPNEHKET